MEVAQWTILLADPAAILLKWASAAAAVGTFVYLSLASAREISKAALREAPISTPARSNREQVVLPLPGYSVAEIRSLGEHLFVAIENQGKGPFGRIEMTLPLGLIQQELVKSHSGFDADPPDKVIAVQKKTVRRRRAPVSVAS